MSNSIGYIRSVNYKLDGSVTYEIMVNGVRAIYKTDLSNLCVGDTILISGKIKVPDFPTNPGEFNYSEYLRNKGISGVLYPENLEIVSRSNIGRIVNSFSVICLKLKLYALNSFDVSYQGIVAAVFMGDKSLVDDETVRSFKLSNCSHLLAVSGTHFSGFLMIIVALMSELHLKKRHSVPIYVLFCLLLGSFTGWSESVTRAAIMSCCAYSSRDYLSGMSLASIVMIIANPFSCMSSGFRMSFMAALFIRLFNKRIGDLLEYVGLTSFTARILSPMMSATLGMMPFWIVNTYYFSLIHILVQLFASTLATAACIFFIPSVITGLPFACEFTLNILVYLMSICSKYAFLGSTSRSISNSLLYSIFLFIVVLLMPKGILRRYALIILTIVLGTVISINIFQYSNKPEFTVLFPDVGQGDCCLILCDDKSVLIDGGISDEGKSTLANLLDYYCIDKVDLAIATHMDEDHIGGLEYLDSIGRVDCILTCFDLTRGNIITLGKNVFLECIWPLEADNGGNEDSIVLMLRGFGFSLMLTGDIGFESENIISNLSTIDCDVLKVAHHGSAYSTSTEFLSCCTPEVSIISVGRFNSYGHPSEDTLQRLYDANSVVYRTDQSGLITISVYKSNYEVEEYLS